MMFSTRDVLGKDPCGSLLTLIYSVLLFSCDANEPLYVLCFEPDLAACLLPVCLEAADQLPLNSRYDRDAFL